MKKQKKASLTKTIVIQQANDVPIHFHTVVKLKGKNNSFLEGRISM